MPLPYFHVVYTLPSKLRDIAYQNKRVIYDLLMKADPQQQPDIAPDAPRVLSCPCPRCSARMIVIEVFARGCEPRWRPTPSSFDTS